MLDHHLESVTTQFESPDSGPAALQKVDHSDTGFGGSPMHSRPALACLVPGYIAQTSDFLFLPEFGWL